MIFTLSWEEELSTEQFDELCTLSRQYHEARRVAAESEQKYHQRVKAMASQWIDAKLTAIGATLNTWDHSHARMINEGFANPQPRLNITVSNAPKPGTTAILD